MASDPRISKIFYYFEQHTNIESGRTVGRKIGVVQEILCKKLLLTSEKICDSVIYEPKVPGRSGATHKVEFVLLQPRMAVNLAVEKSVEIVPGTIWTLLGVNSEVGKAVFSDRASKAKRFTIPAGFVGPAGDKDTGLLVKLSSIGRAAVRLSVIDTKSHVATIESKRVGAQRFSGSDKLGSGIQTIEKAKQASLVAVDFDLNFNGTLLAQGKGKVERKFKSFVVLGNGVHWTAHDLAILETYVDYTYLANDDAIIRYADFVRNLADQRKEDFFDFFMAYFQGMTKTPPDAFTVTNKDFTAMRPTDAGPLLLAVEDQIKPYPVSTA